MVVRSSLLESSVIESVDALPALLQRHTELYWRGRKQSLLLLTGELGAGKTTLVRALGRCFGIEENINSPTFNLCNVYAGQGIRLYHYDLYRLSGTEELWDLGFEERWSGRLPLDEDVRQEFYAVEWWQKVGEELFRELAASVPVYEYRIAFPESSSARSFDLYQWF